MKLTRDFNCEIRALVRDVEFHILELAKFMSPFHEFNPVFLFRCHVSLFYYKLRSKILECLFVCLMFISATFFH